MNQIFPEQGMGLPNPLIGMPNFDGGNGLSRIGTSMGGGGGDDGNIPRKQGDNGAAIAALNKSRSMTIDGSIPGSKPLDTAWIPGEQDRYAASIATGGTTKDKELAFNHNLANQKLGISQGDLALKQRKQMLAEKIADGKATDDEKQEYKMAQIAAQGDITSGQIDQRGNIQRGLQDTKGSQALQQIGARVAGQKSLQASKPVAPMAPTQVNTEQKNAARELVSKQPELATFLKIEPNGNFTVDPNTPLNELSMINNALYSKANKDIELPSTQVSQPAAKPLTGKPVAAKPTAADLIKKYGG